MTRSLAFTVVIFVASLGAAHAVPARPFYEPAKIKLPELHIDLRGTTWNAVDGLDLQLNRTLVFMPDGALRYGTGAPGGKLNQQASWKLQGNQLYFEINNQYREFKGQVVGDMIFGQSWNRAGQRWETKLQRVPNAR